MSPLQRKPDLWRLKEMLRSMERSTIQDLKKKGWTTAHMADCPGQHHDTIAKVLKARLYPKTVLITQ